MHVQLLHDASAVRFHGVHAEIQGDRDLLISLPLGQHLQDLALAAAEQVDGVGHVLAVIVQHGIGNRRTEVAFAARHGAHRGHQIVGHGILQQVTARAGTQNFAHVDRVLMHAQRHHADVRIFGRQPAGGFYAVEFGHGHIHHHHVGPQGGGEFHGLPAVAGFAHNFQVGVGAQDHAEALAHYGMVVS